MRAIGYKDPGTLLEPQALLDIDLPTPEPTGRDLLVEVKAISVNPVDVKLRARIGPDAGQWKVLGWDAVGIVRSVGSEAVLFHPDDAVFYAGAIDRPGTNSEFHLVDERIVGKKPTCLDWASAAALPLTAITAWEGLFDRLEIGRPVAGAAPVLLIIGGAGGVGSIAIQLARNLTKLQVIATASRPETVDWVTKMGAHRVIDHSQPLAKQISELGLGAPAFVFSTTQSAQHLSEIAALIAPQGRFALIDDPPSVDISAFKKKSVSVHWESMFTRSLFQTADMEEQGKLLSKVAGLVDQGMIRTTMTERLSPINAENLKQAHAQIEKGTMIGKLVLEEFEHSSRPALPRGERP